MKAIVIEEAEFERIFEDFAREVDLAAFEALEFVPNEELNRAKDAVQKAKRKWIYEFRTLQARLRASRVPA